MAQPNGLNPIFDGVVTARGFNANGTLVTDGAYKKTFFVAKTGVDTNTGLTVDQAKLTIQSAVNATTGGIGERIIVFPGSYDETVTISAKSNLVIIGAGGRGQVFIEPSAAGAEGLQIKNCDDVTLINIGVDGDDTSDYGLNVQDVSRFRAYGCKFELGDGTGPAVLLDGDADGQTADALFDDCEFAWAGKGILADDSAYGYVTQVTIRDSRFHNLATVGVGVAASGLWKNLILEGCTFDNKEDGTAPTDYILLSDNGNTGIITNNSFATATNATGVLTIGTGLLWVANRTEAGVSTARPA